MKLDCCGLSLSPAVKHQPQHSNAAAMLYSQQIQEVAQYHPKSILYEEFDVPTLLWYDCVNANQRKHGASVWALTACRSGCILRRRDLLDLKAAEELKEVIPSIE
jgi:hypothetical protein